MPEVIQQMVAKGEGVDLEFKTCRNQVNRDVYETFLRFFESSWRDAFAWGYG